MLLQVLLRLVGLLRHRLLLLLLRLMLRLVRVLLLRTLLLRWVLQGRCATQGPSVSQQGCMVGASSSLHPRLDRLLHVVLPVGVGWCC